MKPEAVRVLIILILTFGGFWVMEFRTGDPKWIPYGIWALAGAYTLLTSPRWRI